MVAVEQVQLTRTEAAVLRVLRDAKRTMPPEEIYRQVWLYLGHRRQRQIRVWAESLKGHVWRIRLKLGGDVIVSEPAGYRLGEFYETHCESCGQELET